MALRLRSKGEDAVCALGSSTECRSKGVARAALVGLGMLFFAGLQGCSSTHPDSPGADLAGCVDPNQCPLDKVELSNSRLRIDRSAILLGPKEGSASFVISNAGPDALHWRVDTSSLTQLYPWLSVSKVEGTVPAGMGADGMPASDEVTVTIDRGAAPDGMPDVATAQIPIESDNGGGQVVISDSASVSGTYAGQVSLFAFRDALTFLSQQNEAGLLDESAYDDAVAAKADLGSIPIGFNLKQQGQKIVGVVNPQLSGIYPTRAEITGSVHGDDITLHFTLSTSGTEEASGSSENPRPYEEAGKITRTVDVNGQIYSGHMLKGDYTEVITGLSSAPVTLVGRLSLAYRGDVGDADLQPDPDADLQDPVPPPSPCKDFDAVTAAELLEKGNVDLAQSVPDFTAFAKRNSGSTTDYFSATTCAEGMKPGTNFCYEPEILLNAWSELQCAMSLTEGKDNDVNASYLDAMNAVLVYYTLQGNDSLTQALSRQWKSTGGVLIDEDLDNLKAAMSSFQQAGSAFFGQTGPLSEIPLSLQRARGFQEILYASHAASRDSVARTRYVQLLSRSRPNPTLLQDKPDEEALREVRFGMIRTLLTGALTGSVLVALQQTRPPTDFELFRQSLQDLSGQLAILNRVKVNPLGYEASFVPYNFRIDQVAKKGANNFLQLLDDAQTDIAIAENQEKETEKYSTSYNNDQNALGHELTSVSQAFENQIVEICGGDALQIDPSIKGTDEQDLAILRQCGRTDGALRSSMLSISEAELRLETAAQRVMDLDEQVNVQEDKLKGLQNIAQATQDVFRETGAGLSALDLSLGQKELAWRTYQEEKQTTKSFFSGFLGAAISGAGTGAAAGPYGAAAGAAVGAILSIFGEVAAAAVVPAPQAIELTRANVQSQKDMLQALQSIKLTELGLARDELEIRTTEKTLLIQETTLQLDVQMAKLQYQQEQLQVLGLIDKVRLALDQRHVRDADVGTAYLDPTNRLLRDSSAIAAEQLFEQAQLSTFFAARALEYEENSSYSPLANRLFAIRSAYSTQDQGGLERFANDMLKEYNKFRSAAGNAQALTSRLSIRDHVLVLPDRKTFQAYILDGRHRDSDGNLQIDFSTSIEPNNPVFSSDVFNDRITDIRVNLVGARLGTTARVSLRQEGASILRGQQSSNASDDLREWLLTPRTASVQASINRSQEQLTGDFGKNTDFVGRSVAFSRWILTIDLSQPDNRMLDLSSLEDIELYIDHEAFTLQQ